jgi:hypothetical protein
MTALLVLVTIVSLAIAGVLAIYVRQLTRAERERSEASAAALADMIGPAHLEAPASFDAPIRLGAGGAETPPPQQLSSVMFGAAEPAAASPRMFLIPMIGLFVVIAALSAIYVWNRSSTHATAAAAESADAPLELVALRHQRRGDVMTISGLVRNPHGGRTIQALSAVAFTFDKQGSFLASGRAPLDFPLLQPGDESPFTVTVPNSPAIGRYRVTFRTESGIVPHVDRRSDSQVALQPSRERQNTDRRRGALRAPGKTEASTS